LKISDAGTHTISIDALAHINDDLNIYLHDINKGTYHNLKSSDFKFYPGSSTYLNRFELAFAKVDKTLNTPKKSMKTVSIHYNTNAEKLKVVKTTEIKLKIIHVYDLHGKIKW